KKTMPVILLLILGACTKMDHYYEGFIERAANKYVGKADSVNVYSGKNRLKITYLISPDPSARNVHIYWNDGLDSLVVPRVQGKDYYEVFVNGLQEGVHILTLLSADGAGRTSVPVELRGRAYGDRYQAGLPNRIIQEMESLREGVKVTWFEDFSETMIGTEITYPKAS